MVLVVLFFIALYFALGCITVSYHHATTERYFDSDDVALYIIFWPIAVSAWSLQCLYDYLFERFWNDSRKE